jgi:predicted transcriptional regulator
MNLQQFKQKLRDLKINQIRLANDLGISNQQVSNWNKKEEYPKYLEIYFENFDNKEELKILKEKIKNLM